MQSLIDLLPVVLFYVAYKFSDFRTAIAVMMVAMTLQVALTWLITRRVHRMTLISAGLVVGLGGISLLLRNELIFKWKPTILFWVFAIVFLGSQFIGAKPIAQRFVESASKDALSIPADDWRTLNIMWVAFFALVGALNLYVAYSFPEDVWVNFKLFGLTGLTLLFALVQAFWLSRHEARDGG
ncbi:MAG: septation protein A [Gammaproteobacteria bacterium]|nr:MAG: septation protein A [Gammaproteobacteria bacterium]